MHLTLRIDDELNGPLTAAVDAAGVTRSRWIARLIERELGEGAEPETVSLPRYSDGPKRQVALRLSEQEIAAVEAAAAALGMTPSQWIWRRIRGGITNPEGPVSSSQNLQKYIGESIHQIIHIGRNLNQAQRAMNASLKEDSGLDTLRIAKHITAMRDDIWEAIDQVEKQLISLAVGEQKYWRREG